LVAELEWIDRHIGNVDLLVLTAVEQRCQARGRAHAHVIIRAGDDELVGFQVLVEDKLAGLRAFHPQILRHLALEEAAYLRPDDVGYPIHDRLTESRACYLSTSAVEDKATRPPDGARRARRRPVAKSGWSRRRPCAASPCRSHRDSCAPLRRGPSRRRRRPPLARSCARAPRSSRRSPPRSANRCGA